MAAQAEVMEKLASVNFVCQRCCQPLKLDNSFSLLDEQGLSELTAPLLTHTDNEGTVHVDTLYKDDSSSEFEISRKTIMPIRLTESGNGFMLVGDTSPGLGENTGLNLRVISYLFDIMSDQSDVDHPLCEECTDHLLDQMDQQLKVAEDECRDYKEFLEQLNSTKDDVDLDKLNEELDILQEKEEQLKKELEALEKENNKVQDELKEMQDENVKLQNERNKYWHDHNKLAYQLMVCNENKMSANNQLQYAKQLLDKLQKTNVFNSTFHIWHSGHFGTINNFRLGRLPSVPVDWSEINAAWGQTVLLLTSLARKMNFTFKKYRLVPYGNHSYIESLEGAPKELPLYFSGGLRFMWDTKFDQAMVAFLDCLQQFKEEVEKGDTSFCLPYKMEKGRLEDSNGKTYLVKMQFNTEEQWTKAMKFMLTNLKWGLAWVASQFNVE